MKESDYPSWEQIRFAFIYIFFEGLTILTRYFPFSMLWLDRGFHYKNRYLSQIQRVIRNEIEKFRKGTTMVMVGGYDVTSPTVVLFISLLGKEPDLTDATKEILLGKIAKEMNINRNDLYLNQISEPGFWKLVLPSKYIFKE